MIPQNVKAQDGIVIVTRASHVPVQGLTAAFHVLLIVSLAPEEKNNDLFLRVLDAEMKVGAFVCPGEQYCVPACNTERQDDEHVDGWEYADSRHGVLRLQTLLEREGHLTGEW